MLATKREGFEFLIGLDWFSHAPVGALACVKEEVNALVG